MQNRRRPCWASSSWTSRTCVVEMPFIDPGEQVLSYATQKPNGELSEVTWAAPDLYGRLTLAGRQPDGRWTDVDPGLGVTRLNGRLYLEGGGQVPKDAARSIRSGTPPRHRLIPHGTNREYSRWTLDGNRTW